MMFAAYILKCADGTLYAGSTNDIERRVRVHNTSKSGAKYTRARRPVALAHVERFRSLAKARAREAAIKRMTRTEKLTLISAAKRT